MISDTRLKNYWQTLKNQENGRTPDVHKINGNMAWYQRAKPDSHPMNQYFNSLGRNGSRVLSDLQMRLAGGSGSNSNSVKSTGFQVAGISGYWILGGISAVAAIVYAKRNLL